MKQLNSDDLQKEFYSDCHAAGAWFCYLSKSKIPQNLQAESVILAILILETISIFYNDNSRERLNLWLRL